MIRDIRTILLEQARTRRSAKEEVTGKPINLDMIESLVESICQEFNEEIQEDYESVKNYIIDKLAAEGERTVGDFSCISDNSYKPWIDSRKVDTPWFFWNRYVQFLNKNHPISVIQSTDSATDYILDRLGDPKEESFNKRGLVMGSVQMGKTLNYVGLINKAADMGYKLIIILAGGTENLRKQTQYRINKGFIDKRDEEGEEYNKRKPISYTNSTQDFNKLEITPPSLYQTSNPIVLVCKKNAPVLKNLLEDWVIKAHGLQSDDFPAGPGHIAGDNALLFIDDEADYASVNTKDMSKDSNERTKINERIRQILARFKKRSYLAYTATPFANIFIDPDGDNNEWEDDDLFPKNFIYKLALPSNYRGPRNYFGSSHESLSNVRTLSVEHGNRMVDFTHIDRDSDDKEEHVYEINGIPEDLKEAIRYFFLLVTERSLRGQGIEHKSMMINVSYLIKLQDALYMWVEQYAKDLQRSINSYHKLPLQDALSDNNISDLKNTFDNVFTRTSKKDMDFKEILKNLNQALSIKVMTVHSKSEDVLDYSHYKKGLNVIAIGGFSLSRGLTLEGLSVSFLDRTTKTSDTLLQMGRWFGYRDGYDDLCKIYIDYQSQEYFIRINETLEELYAELDTMNRANLTPYDFGLQVRDHAGGLLITAKAKMRTAQITTVDISFWGQKYQSVWLPNNIDDMNQNHRTVINLIQNLDRNLYQENNAPKRHIWREVPAEYVFNFLDNFIESNRSDNENIFIREFLKDRKDEFSNWTIELDSNLKPSSSARELKGSDFNAIKINDDIEVFSGLRKFIQPRGETFTVLKTDRSQIGASNQDEKILTSAEEVLYNNYKENQNNAAQAARTALKNPVLTIFPRIPFYQNDDNSDRKLIFPELDGIFLFSISIPRLMKNGSHPIEGKQKYALNTTAINALKEIAIRQEEDSRLTEITEEEADE
jgi:hypothetical protein